MNHYKKYPSFISEKEIFDLDSYSLKVEYYKKQPTKNNYEIALAIFLDLFKHFAKDILSVIRYKNIKGKNVFFYESINQYNALLPLKSRMPGSVFINLNRYDANRLPQFLGILFSLLYLPHFYSILKESTNRGLFRSGNYHYIEGMYKWWCLYLKARSPKTIFFANDHLLWHRVLRKAGQYNKIPTIYIQHASVDEGFPKLEFDLSLLEGQDAIDKYSKKGINVKTALIGMPKFDKYYSRINSRHDIQKIGICTNILDEKLLIKELCFGLRSFFKLEKIYLRPHPGDTRKDFHNDLCKIFSLDFSDSTKENSFEFLSKVDLNIAGESSVHLEAVLMNVYPIHYKLNNERWDVYSYLKNGLVENSFNNILDLIVFINTIKNNKPNVRERAKYYVDTVNTQFDGKSTSKAISIIDSFLLEFYNKL